MYINKEDENYNEKHFPIIPHHMIIHKLQIVRG